MPQHVQSDFFFWITLSPKKQWWQKKKQSLGISDFKADDLHRRHSITFVLRKEVPERQMKFYKYKLSAGWQVWNATVKKYRFFHIASREHRYGRLNISCYSSYKQIEEILDQSQAYIIFLKEWKCFQDLYLTDIMQAQAWALREGKLISRCVRIS